MADRPFDQGLPVRLMPCEVTSVTPLEVTVLGEAGIPGVKIAGATYSLGFANALFFPVGQPIILPIG